jgi:hypothetical protein
MGKIKKLEEREEACNIVSPQSNESNVLVLPATELQPRMTDVKGLILDGTESGNKGILVQLSVTTKQ